MIVIRQGNAFGFEVIGIEEFAPAVGLVAGICWDGADERSMCVDPHGVGRGFRWGDGDHRLISAVIFMEVQKFFQDVACICIHGLVCLAFEHHGRSLLWHRG